MENEESQISKTSYLTGFLRRCLFLILSIGPIPRHIAFIMDGNRRYSKKFNLREGVGHKLGFSALTSMLKYCFELNVKYVTVYAFSIDNFKRSPDEVKSLMKLLKEKIEGLLKDDSIVNRYGIRVHFVGDLNLLDDSVRLAAEKVMVETSSNSKGVLSVCIAYTSTNEIVHSVEESCEEKWDELRILDMKEKEFISLMDIENKLYMKVAPNPDIVIRTSGESRLSNFLLWQSERSILYSPSVLWPEIALRHLVWAVLIFQRKVSGFVKKHD